MVHASVHVIGEFCLSILPQHPMPSALLALSSLPLEESHSASVFGGVAGRSVDVLIEPRSTVKAVGDIGEWISGIFWGGLRLEQLDILHLKSSLVYNSKQMGLCPSKPLSKVCPIC
jgi:hypothetical protein